MREEKTQGGNREEAKLRSGTPTSNVPYVYGMGNVLSSGEHAEGRKKKKTGRKGGVLLGRRRARHLKQKESIRALYEEGLERGTGGGLGLPIYIDHQSEIF